VFFGMQGSLRDALDCGLLSRPGGFLQPSSVLTLAHDVAAAILHLHSEGIVHGDLKVSLYYTAQCQLTMAAQLPPSLACAVM
jgi:serine/threonine protein kinase